MKPTSRRIRHIIRRLAIGAALTAAALISLRYASFGPVAGIVQIIAGASVLAACVVAVLDDGPRRVFATGMAVCGVACLLMRLSNAPYFASGLGTYEISFWLHERLSSDEWVDQLGHVFTHDPAAATPPTNSATQSPANVTPPPPLPAPGTIPIPGQSQAVQGGSPSGLQAAAEWAEREQKLRQVDRQVNELKRAAKLVNDIERVAGQIPPGTAIGNVIKRRVPNDEDFFATANSLWLLLFGYAGELFAQHVHKQRSATMVN